LKSDRPLVLIRGGGDLATGVAARLHRSGFAVVVTEIAKPLAVRRLVALGEAVFAGEVTVEDIRGRLVDTPEAVPHVLDNDEIPVLIDPEARCRHALQPIAIVDGRMRKKAPELGIEAAPIIIGLGPGFTVGIDCHAIVETNRGHHMGRVYWEGSAEADTAIPEPVNQHGNERVLRAPCDGVFKGTAGLASMVSKGEIIAKVDQEPLIATFDGVVRGILHDGVHVTTGMKVGDLDPRGIPEFCSIISDKSLAVGGGVLEALLSNPDIRSRIGR
jgi:xanthine dehydrogenase accessory factor